MINRKVQPGEAIVQSSVSTENTRNILNDSIGVIDGDVPITPQFVEIKDLSELVNPQTNVVYIYQKNFIYWDGTEFVTAGSGILNTGTPLIQLNVGTSQTVDNAGANEVTLNFVSNIKDDEFTHVDGTSQIVTSSGGRIEVDGHVTIFGSQGNYRFTTRNRVSVNGDDGGVFVDSTYLRSATGSNESYMVFKRTIDNVPPGATIELSVQRISNTAGNAATVVNGCCVTIKKV